MVVGCEGELRFVADRAGDAREAAGYTLAQKMVGKACGKPGVLAGEYCEPRMTTVGSQDTTGPMTRDELKVTPYHLTR